jgi:HAD superfamily hydrolase (TIGR01509 family)
MRSHTSNGKAYIFDMDGTILDLHFDRFVWHHRLPEEVSKALNVPVDVANDIVNTKLAPLKNTLNWYDLDYWSKEFNLDITEIEIEMSHLIKPRPGAIDYLKKVKRGNLIILASNAYPKSMSRKLSLTGIANYFDIIISSHEIGFCKEQLKFWEKLQSQIGFSPSNTILIDDNLTVLRTAKEFGIKNLFGIKNPSSQGAPVNDPEFQLIRNFEEINCQIS